MKNSNVNNYMLYIFSSTVEDKFDGYEYLSFKHNFISFSCHPGNKYLAFRKLGLIPSLFTVIYILVVKYFLYSSQSHFSFLVSSEAQDMKQVISSTIYIIFLSLHLYNAELNSLLLKAFINSKFDSMAIIFTCSSHRGNNPITTINALTNINILLEQLVLSRSLISYDLRISTFQINKLKLSTDEIFKKNLTMAVILDGDCDNIQLFLNEVRTNWFSEGSVMVSCKCDSSGVIASHKHQLAKFDYKPNL